MGKYSVLLDRHGKPVVVERTLWLFSPARAETLERELGGALSEPLGIEESLRLGLRLGALYVCVAPDDAPLPTLYAWATPDAWRFDERLGTYVKQPRGAPSEDLRQLVRQLASKRPKVPLPPLGGEADATALMSADSARFTGVPRETAPEEYAPSGELLKKQRERAGLTQEELAKASGVARSTIARIEAGHDKPHSRVVRLLAKALGIPRASLLGYEFDEGVKVEDIEFFEPDKVDRLDFYGDDEEE